MCWKKNDIDELTVFIKKHAVSNNSNDLMVKLRNISSWNCQHYINEKIAEINKGIIVPSKKSSTFSKFTGNIVNFLKKKEKTDENINVNNVILLKNLDYTRFTYKYTYDNNIPKNISINEYLINNILTDSNNVKHIFKITITGLTGYNHGAGRDNTPDYLYIYINENSKHIILYKTNSQLIEYNVLNGKYSSWFTVIEINKSIKKYNAPEDITKEKIVEFNQEQVKGGYKKSSKFKTKEVLGKLRRVYNIPNSKKEHIMHKGKLITISEYKKLIKNKR